MVSSTPGTETDIALHDILQGAEQGHNEQGMADTKEMLQHIGSLKPTVFGVVDLCEGFYQMPLHKDCWAATAFISFRGIYEWTRVPMGLLPSSNFFQNCMSVHILNGPFY